MGLGAPQDYGKAREWYGKYADQGNAMAKNELGVLYYYGRGGPRNHTQARRLIAQAAAQGDARAQTHLGYFYLHGVTGEKSEEKARQWLAKAVTQSDTRAKEMLESLAERVQQPAQHVQETYDSSPQIWVGPCSSRMGIMQIGYTYCSGCPCL